jgi:ketosteroid isomerase-like protein
MKKFYLILITAALAITSCQKTPKTAFVDVRAEKIVVDSVLDKFNSAFSAGDAATLATYLTEDALCMGTDPSEFMNKQQLTAMWTQMFVDSVPKIIYMNERKIIVAADCNSATMVDQYMMPDVISKLIWRNAYHLVKINGDWKILVLNCSFIHKNEDLPKLSKALM